MTFPPFFSGKWSQCGNIQESSFGCPRIARVISSEELGTMSKNNLRQITLVRGPIWGILTLIISWNKSITRYLTLDSVSWVDLNATRAFVIRKLKAKNTREKIPLDLYMRMQVSYAHSKCRPMWEKMKNCQGIGLSGDLFCWLPSASSVTS